MSQPLGVPGEADRAGRADAVAEQVTQGGGVLVHRGEQAGPRGCGGQPGGTDASREVGQRRPRSRQPDRVAGGAGGGHDGRRYGPVPPPRSPLDGQRVGGSPVTGGSTWVGSASPDGGAEVRGVGAP